MDLTACIAPRAIESQSLWSGLRHGVKPSTMREPRALRDVLPVCMCEPALGVPPPNIWKSHPLTRLSGAGRTGVGHRRWAQQRTPALSPQTEQRPPSTPASAASPCQTSLRQLVLHPHSRPAEPAKPEGRNRGARGELFPPPAFPLFLPFLPFLPFTPGNRGSSRGIRPCRGRVRPASRRRRRSRGGCGRLRRGRRRYSGF